MASSAVGATFATRLARIICGDPNPRGPGYREIAMPHETDGDHPGLDQRTHLGSWVDVPRLALPDGATVVAATVWPTAPAAGRQVLFSWRGAGGAALSLEIDKDGVVARAAAGGREIRVATGRQVLERAWYDVWLALDPKAGTLSVGQRARERHPRFDDEGEAKTAFAGAFRGGAGRAALAARVAESAGAWPSAHYNGKLERPTVWAGAKAAAALAAQRAARPPARGAKGLAACWDFSIGIDSLKVRDVGRRGFHGKVGNLPTRGMTGANWSGEEQRWTHAPDEYGAIHFHDDDIGDVGWKKSLE